MDILTKIIVYLVLPNKLAWLDVVYGCLMEASFTFLKTTVKKFRLDIVKTTQVSFGMMPEIFYLFYIIILYCECPETLAAVMMESVDTQGVAS